jgi:hypothetical protein
MVLPLEFFSTTATDPVGLRHPDPFPEGTRSLPAARKLMAQADFPAQPSGKTGLPPARQENRKVLAIN